jgi:hypothetical protein
MITEVRGDQWIWERKRLGCWFRVRLIILDNAAVRD